MKNEKLLKQKIYKQTQLFIIHQQRDFNIHYKALSLFIISFSSIY